MSDSRSPPPAASVRARLAAALAARFGIDTRALAVFRISLGLLLVTDLALRARHLEAFYTDAGVFPRTLLYELYPTLSQLSVHTLSGAAWAQALLFLLAGLCGLALLLGYHTRVALLLSFLLLVSLHARNPGVLNGGDSVLRRLLFWGLFLPLGDRWSLDALGRTNAPRERVATLASAALLVQVVLVYAVNAAFKLRGDLWLDGVAVRYVLSLQQFTILFGDTLAQFPTLLHAFDLLWLGLVLASPLLLVLTGRLRTLLVLAFAGMHLGMLLTMRIGLFPLISLTALLVFLPPSVWSWLSARVSDPLERTAARLGISARLARFRSNSASASGSTLGSRAAALRRWCGRAVPAVVAVLLALILVWNAMAVGLVSPPGDGESALDPSDNTWNMFAPHPPTADWWYVAPGELGSGERVDAYYLSPPVENRPSTMEMYPSSRWRKYMSDLRYADNEGLQREFAGYLCSRWNRTNDDELATVTLSYVEQPTRFDGPEPTEQHELLEYNCSTEA
ncbi:HTTM domain-containing protein [Haloprofundus salinisoli]|uniref:HTTM domain-containing protein n=1 Tax=Haloprofundus salinisoli TaxID=2876193 RepID=UPI001CCA0F70|nr:HTTM domain-containing protein [Haloprofundus salinisoli]